jgi:hypothetical protein
MAQERSLQKSRICSSLANHVVIATRSKRCPHPVAEMPNHACTNARAVGEESNMASAFKQLEAGA